MCICANYAGGCTLHSKDFFSVLQFANYFLAVHVLSLLVQWYNLPKKGGFYMQNSYVTISAPAKKLLKELAKMYIANDYNTFETCLQFSSTYLDAKASKYSPVNQQLVYELYKANYIDNMQTLHLTPQGLHYDLCFWSYWLHKAIYPGSVSLAFTIVANIALFYIRQWLP